MSFASPRISPGALVFALVPLLAACGGGRTAIGPVPATGTHSGAGAPVTAVVSIAIPAKATSAAGRRPAYVSPATQSARLTAVDGGGTTVLDTAVALGLGAQGCSASIASTVCQVALPLAPGSYSLTFIAYDGPLVNGQVSGNALSAVQRVPATIHEGQANAISFTLGGMPASLLVAPDNTDDHVFALGPLTFGIAGVRPQQFYAVALDADKNFIVGAGAPAISVLADASKLIVTPSASAPGAFSLQVIGAAYGPTPIVLTVAATPQASAYAQTVAEAYTIDALQEMWVTDIDAGSVDAYAVLPGTVPARIGSDTINGIAAPEGIAADKNGNLWVLDLTTATVAAYTPGNGVPLPGQTVSFAGGYGRQDAELAIDRSGMLWVSDEATNVIRSYAPGASTPSATIAGSGSLLNGPEGLTFAPDGTLWVANDNNTVLAFAPGSSTPIAADTISGAGSGLNGPFGVGFDAAGHLWVGNFNANDVEEFTPGGSTPLASVPVATGSDPVADASGNVWVTGGRSPAKLSDIVSGSVALTLSGGLTNSQFIAFTP